MASIALDGILLGTADGLTRPGPWRVSRGYDHPTFLHPDRLFTPSFARP